MRGTDLRLWARAVLRNEVRAVETEIKFAGYLEQQKKSIAKLKAAEAVAIPEWLEYGAISGLSREMRETLERVRPITIGQASRIPGVTPAALGLVHVSIKIRAQMPKARRHSRVRRETPKSAMRGGWPVSLGCACPDWAATR